MDNMSSFSDRRRGAGLVRKIRNSMKELGSLITGDSLSAEEFLTDENRKRFVSGGISNRTKSLNRKRSRISNRSRFSVRSSRSSNIRSVRSALHASSEFDFSALGEPPARLTDRIVEMLMETIHPVIDRNRDPTCKVLRLAVQDLVIKIEEGYGQTAFHNFCHAADVAQCMFTFITKYLKPKLAKHEPFFLLIVCLCHDLGHPGTGIDFLHQNNILTEFNTLEDYHIFRTQQLIETHPVFNHYMDHDLKLELHHLSRVLIEATNLANHAQLNRRLSTMRLAGNRLNEDHMILLIKLCDLANVIRDFEDAKVWAGMLAIETESVRVLEHKGNAHMFGTVQTMAGRLQELQADVRQHYKYELPKNLGPNTLTFISNIVQPLAAMLPRLDPEAGAEYIARLDNNVSNWLNHCSSNL
mmetsp:Transcript_6115/g.7030  ORF Transcript_6115/g.7030 Transcript_6115/m.7030 type:complete len:413 (-) Transcript_6115:145-1383(-)